MNIIVVEFYILDKLKNLKLSKYTLDPVYTTPIINAL